MTLHLFCRVEQCLQQFCFKFLEILKTIEQVLRFEGLVGEWIKVFLEILAHG